jgi:hypothetical protein
MSSHATNLILWAINSQTSFVMDLMVVSKQLERKVAKAGLRRSKLICALEGCLQERASIVDEHRDAEDRLFIK